MLQIAAAAAAGPKAKSPSARSASDITFFVFRFLRRAKAQPATPRAPTVRAWFAPVAAAFTGPLAEPPLGAARCAGKSADDMRQHYPVAG